MSRSAEKLGPIGLIFAAIVVILAGTGVSAAASPQLDVTGLLAALNGLTPTPNTAWGIDPATGQLRLTISSAAPSAGAARLLAFAADHAGAVQVRRTSAPIAEQIYGGDEISDGQILCSAGFNVTKDGVPYLLTAGHCTAGMPDWNDVGPSVASNFPGVDFGLVREDDAVSPGVVDLYNQSVQPITEVGAATVGEKVCASGEATGVTCGAVLAVDQTVDYGNGAVVHGLIETNVHTDHGDSGGPLFAGNVGLGTVSGGDGNTDYFQPLAPELAAYGLSLAATDYDG